MVEIRDHQDSYGSFARWFICSMVRILDGSVRRVNEQITLTVPGGSFIVSGRSVHLTFINKNILFNLDMNLIMPVEYDIPLERKCTREDPSVGGNVKNCIRDSPYKTLCHILCHIPYVGFISVPPTPETSRTHFLFNGI